MGALSAEQLALAAQMLAEDPVHSRPQRTNGVAYGCLHAQKPTPGAGPGIRDLTAAHRPTL
jgi:hypothetical protein